MSRVWRHFFRNLAWPVGTIAYIFGSITAGAYIALALGFVPEAGIVTSAMIMIVFPMLVYIVRDMWLDAKDKVDRENRQLMRDLGKKY